MEPRLESISEKKLAGFGARTTVANDSTVRLWRTLMPRRNEIGNRASSSYVSMRVYSRPGMSPAEMFAPTTEFEKWAAVEVAGYDAVPEDIDRYSLAGGLYAVFVHRGPASAFPRTMRYIYGTWLPGSDYELDDREHFEVLPEGWSATDPNASEEIWIPIRPRVRD